MAIDERAFINGKRAGWEKLSVIVERTKNGGLKQLSREELPALGSLYRRAAADLAFARAQGANPNLVLYLNELVGNAHGVIYAEEAGGWSRLGRFFAYGLADTLRRRMPFVLAAIALNLIGALLAYVIIHRDPTQLGLYFPDQLRDAVDFWKSGGADKGDIPLGDGVLFSSSLMTHNTQVGITAFATGITLVLPVILMFQNGTMIGALTAVVQPTGHLASMWAGLLPHGICELSATFICGGAGLLTGWALDRPRSLLAQRRADRQWPGRLQADGRDHSAVDHRRHFGRQRLAFLASPLGQVQPRRRPIRRPHLLHLRQPPAQQLQFTKGSMMTTYTLEVTDVPEDLLQLLDRRAKRQAKDRSAYVRDLLRQDLKNGAESEMSMADVLAPFHEAVRASGSTEEEAIDVFDEALREVRAERRQTRSTNAQRPL